MQSLTTRLGSAGSGTLVGHHDFHILKAHQQYGSILSDFQIMEVQLPLLNLQGFDVHQTAVQDLPSCCFRAQVDCTKSTVQKAAAQNSRPVRREFIVSHLTRRTDDDRIGQIAAKTR